MTETKLNKLTLDGLKKAFGKLRKENKANPNTDAGNYLRGLTDFQLGVLIASDSYSYGRPFDKAIENAVCHLEDRERYIKLVSREVAENIF